MKLIKHIAVAGALSLSVATGASALTLQVVDSLAVGSFGVAFDGTNVWVSDSGGILRQVNQSNMTLTGTQINQGRWSANAWDGSHFLTAQGNQVFKTNPDGTSAGSITLNGFSGGLIDGLDYDHDEIWWSRDVDVVNRFDSTGNPVGAQPAVGGAGGYSGVERIDTANSSFLILINDAFNPRKICKSSFTGVFDAVADCATLANSRYEDLAYDGRYLYVADFNSSRLDKIDLIGEGGSIFEPPTCGAAGQPACQTPIVSTSSLFATGLAIFFLMGPAISRRREDNV
jgi:DNA-binding beta-propeller fold protein YncE